MIADINPYPAMKDSGVPWLGEVPGHWHVRRLKQICRLAYGDALAAGVREHGAVPVFGSNGRVGVHSTANTKAPCIVIGRKGSFGKVNFSVEPVFAIDTTFFIDGRFSAADMRWLYFLLGWLRLDEVSKDSAVPGLDREDAYQRLAAVPPLPEQSAIVRFLDHADRRIRRYIRAKQKLIKLLEEQKQAIIHRAVTRGLDPNVRLKPSGVEWLGDVPEHWEVVRTRYLFREVDRRSKDGQEMHLSMSQKLGLVPSTIVEQRTLVSQSYEGGKLCEKDDLVLNRLKAHLGVFALARQSGVISPDYTVLRKISPMAVRYFEHILRSPACRAELRVRAKGIVEGFWRLYTDDFYDIRVPVPPVAEQREIIAQIDDATGSISKTMARTEREISLLREYRTRLIADVVTGKLDVRGVEVPALDEAESLDEVDSRESVEAGEMADIEEAADADE